MKKINEVLKFEDIFKNSSRVKRSGELVEIKIENADNYKCYELVNHNFDLTKKWIKWSIKNFIENKLEVKRDKIKIGIKNGKVYIAIAKD